MYRYGFGGPQCERAICPTNPQCAGHGACLIGVCICDKGFAGIACHQKDTYAPVIKNLATLTRDRLHSILADSESLKLATIRSVYRSQLAQLESQVKYTYYAINECLGTKRGFACERIQELRQQALDLNFRHKELRKKMTLVEEDAMHGPPGRKFGHQENMHVIRELAFAMFANQRRVGVKTGMSSASATAIDAKLAHMWKTLEAKEVAMFMDQAKDAIAAEQRAWAVAHELFVDEQLTKIHSGSPGLSLSNSLRGRGPLPDKNSKHLLAHIDHDWAVLSSEKRLAYFVNSSRLAFDVRTKSDNLPFQPSFSMLGTATNNLAFDLFAQSQWLPAFASLSQNRKKRVKRTELLTAVDQDVLARYQSLKPKLRLAWVNKAKKVLYPKVFFSEKWRNFSTQILPNFQVVGFQIGLRGTMPPRGAALKSLTETLEAAVEQVTGGAKYQLTAFDAVPTNTAIFSFVLVLASDVHSLSIKVLNKLSECVNSDSFRDSMVDAPGLKMTTYFPAGGEPHVVFGPSVTPKCPDDYACAKGSVCMQGICSCPPGRAGHDCSEKVSCDCNPDRGLCDLLTGRCECYGSWTGKQCDVLACPNDCTGHGLCSNGTCTCNALYTGADCSHRTCQSGCSGHGNCCYRDKCTRKPEPNLLVSALEHIVGISEEKKEKFETLSEDKQPYESFKNPNGYAASPTCMCQKGFGGGSCGCPSETPDKECSGRGICFQKQCWCRAGFSGPSCNQPTCIPDDCSGHGMCVAGACMCLPGWAASERGGGCDKRVCLDHDCSGHGVCAKGECDCAVGWDGHHCEKPVCPGDPPCSGHGMCQSSGNLKATASKCVCTGEWYGDACEQRRCFRDPVSNIECNGKGVCKDNTCSCYFRWVGPTCSTELCPNKCNWPRGHCVDGRYCQCKPGYKGFDCSQQVGEENVRTCLY